MVSNSNKKKKNRFSEFSNGILLLVVSGIPSHTCRTAKGQIQKVKSMVARTLQILYNSPPQQVFLELVTHYMAMTNYRLLLFSESPLHCYRQG